MPDFVGTVVVTGAASGIGAAVGAALKQAGTDILGIDVHPAPGIEALDVSDEAAWKGFATSLRGREIVVAGLVNCAGVTLRARLGEVGSRDFQRVMNVNVLGPLLAIRYTPASSTPR